MRLNIVYMGVASAFFLISGCAGSDTPTAEMAGFFNLDAVSGTMTLPKVGTHIVLEDYELTRPDGGNTQLTTCEQVLALKEVETVPSEYFFYRKYAIECYAAKSFLAGRASRDSFVPRSLTDTLADLPATVSPRIGEQAVFDQRKGKGLAEFFGDISPTEQSDRLVSLVLDEAEVDYVVMGQRDLNADGHEDLLLAMTYHLIEGSARGTKLFALSKTAENAPIEVLWDYK